MTQTRNILLLLALTLSIPVLAEDSLTDARSAIEKWVETRQLISQTRSDWQADKDMLERTIAMYEGELKKIDEQMSKVSTNNTQITKEMAEAEALKKSSNEARERTAQFATGFEVKLKQTAPKLPLPLQEILKPLLARMPADPASTKMLPAERMVVCVGVLNELDKFNNAVNVFNEKRKNDKGEEVSVQTLYVGLGAAYFVNDTADFAGTGAPGANGWEWTSNPGIASRVQDAVKMYRNERTALFLTLPVAVK